MLTENKFGKYLTYAIGEIILVVIGILIALAINNWNNERLDKQEAKVTGRNIHDEFAKNQLILRKIIDLYTDSFNASVSLTYLMGLPREELLEHNLDSLFNSSMELDYYFPTSKSFDDVLKSGRLLENVELKNTLMDWISLMDQIKTYDELITNWQYSQYLPYLTSFASLKQMNIYNQKVYGGESKIKTDYYTMFQDIRLENILNNYLYLIQFSIEQLNGIEKVQRKIIDLTINS
ncbi:MAG: DUF6090 family protein [Candidatus Thorarchaeota archaeon]